VGSFVKGAMFAPLTAGILAGIYVGHRWQKPGRGILPDRRQRPSLWLALVADVVTDARARPVQSRY
jgi:hypothetical protein